MESLLPDFDAGRVAGFHRKDAVMEKIKDLYFQYSDRIMSWYNGLEDVFQYGVIFLLLVVGFIIVAYFVLSRISK